MHVSIRRLGIALGSFVAASLVVGLSLAVIAGTGLRPETIPSAVTTFASVVLGFLIYRDIVRREDRTRAAPG